MRSLFSTLRDITLTVVAPSMANIPEGLNAIADQGLYGDLIDEIERFRGLIYVQDNAIPASALDEKGRHHSEYDYEAWHLVLRDRQQALWGAIRVGVHLQTVRATQLEDLQIDKFLSRLPSEVKEPLVTAVQAFICNSRSLYPTFFEPGGWAIAEDGRKGALAPVLAGSIWSLARAVGGGTGVAAATTRHQSAGILKKMGGFEIFFDGSPVPPFYDPYHDCYMELVGFDSTSLNSRLEGTVAHIEEYIRSLPIITRPGDAAVRPAPLVEDAPESAALAGAI